MDINDVRDHLIFQIEDTAVWRALKAHQYPKDKRNGRAAEMLWGLAESLMSQRINNLLAEAATFWSTSDFDVSSMLTKMESKFLGEIGFQRKFRDAEDFLRDLIACYAQVQSEAIESPR